MNKILEKIIGFIAVIFLIALMVFFVLLGINYRGLGDIMFAFNESIVLFLINQSMSTLLVTSVLIILIAGVFDKFKSLPFQYVTPGIIYLVGISVAVEIFKQLMESDMQYYMIIFVILMFVLGIVSSTIGIVFSFIRTSKHKRNGGKK